MRKKTPNLERVKSSLDTIEKTLKEHPEVIERTQDYLSGKLKGETLIEQGKKIVNLKVDKALLDRADSLIPLVKTDPELSTFGRVCTSSILRLAILKGLEVLEQQYS